MKKSVFKRALAHTRTHHPPLQMSGTQRYPGRSRKPPPELKGQVHPDDVQFGSDTDNSTDDETPISEMRRHNDVRAAKVANMPVVVEGKSSKPSSATAKAPKRNDKSPKPSPVKSSHNKKRKSRDDTVVDLTSTKKACLRIALWLSARC